MTKQSLVLIFLSCCVSSTISSGSRGPPGGPGGLLFPYGDRTGRDGTRYKTDYRCEGDNMTIVCDEDDGYDRRIEVVRGNFGRFSIAICNQHGHTDWNVNCMSPSTTKRLKAQCDSLKSCTISVDSTSFPEDSCPGTFKYLEVHYACTSNTAGAKNPPPPPPWINPWIGRPDSSNSTGRNLNYSSSTTTTPSTPPPRKPILVTEKAQTKRIPITTPKSEFEDVESTSHGSDLSDDESIILSSKDINSTEKLSPSGRDTLTISSTPLSKLPQSPSSMSGTSSSTLNSHILSNPISRPRYEQDSSLFHDGNAGEEELYNQHKAEEEGHEDSYLYRQHHQDPLRAPCPPTTARNLQWNWTKRGELSIQQCPIGTTGIARWYCNPDGVWTPEGRPDMSDCKAIAMSNLEAQVRAEDPVNVLISSLAYLTRTKSLYGGDLESSAGIMRTVTNLIQYRFQSSSSRGGGGKDGSGGESLIAEVLQNVMRSVSHILEKSNNQAWNDLAAERRMKVATSLLLSLEENAFLLAGVMNHPENSLDSSELLTMAIYVVDTRLSPTGVFFPPNQLPYVKDSVYISSEDIQGSGRFNRLTEVVFFSFANLHVVLNDAKMTFTSDLKDQNEVDSSETIDLSKRWVLNSRIVSASLGRGGRHVELIRPVTLVLNHLRESDSKYLHTPKCVFWNYETHGWSDAGCRVRETNSSHTVCSCDHLTNFAVAMIEDVGALGGGSIASISGIDPGLMTIIQIVAAIGVSVIIILIVIIFLIVKYGGNIRKWCGRKNCCNKKGSSSGGASNVSSEMEKCQRNFYTGLSPHSTKVMSSLNDRSYSQYVLNAPSNNSGALQQLVGSSSSSSSSSSTTSGIPNGGNSSGSTLSSNTGTEPKGRTLLRASNISSGVPHITLNPYSSQLVENINMMMPPGGDKAEVVYRAVSPHGHVYWEIDPHQQQNPGAYYPENSVELEETIRRNNLAESHPLMAFHHAQQQQHQIRHIAAAPPPQPHHSNTLSHHHPHHHRGGLHHHQSNPRVSDMQTLSTSSTFFNTSHMSGNFGSPSPAVSSSQQQQQIVPEQLQRQVQIRDIKSIPVSVKSSEYIEAKIRTLRASHQQQQKNAAAAQSLQR
ncbi:latrophilin Cirl [Lepeophtheirus salmonis]|uniref:latrophilin Cirl n=1 Tax=Lepeophtheirus salmonis TaxID=72036 RepID=UPI001AE1C6B8|nr:latrophilin Cirl-like [Lepeophtheirus salmonis]